MKSYISRKLPLETRRTAIALDREEAAAVMTEPFGIGTGAVSPRLRPSATGGRLSMAWNVVDLSWLRRVVCRQPALLRVCRRDERVPRSTRAPGALSIQAAGPSDSSTKDQSQIRS